MLKTIAAALALSATAMAAPAFAQDEAPASDITVTGSASLTTQYRLRGISMSDENAAVQAAMTVSHASGFYVGTWASNLAGYGSYGGTNMELDLIAGYMKTFDTVTLDGGIIYYVYPGTSTDYFELYGSVAAPVGPLKGKLGFYYAPDQQAIGSVDNMYTYTDWALPVGDSPVTLKAHLGYTAGKNSTVAGPDSDYLDYSVGVDFTYKTLTLNVSYVDTDIGKGAADAYYAGVGGHDIVDGAVVATLTAAF